MDLPEALARRNFDQLLDAGGWKVQHYRKLDLSVGRGAAVREFPPKTGFADDALFVDPRSRRVFAFHRPETLAGWAMDARTDDVCGGDSRKGDARWPHVVLTSAASNPARAVAA